APEECVVVEDAAAGVMAGLAAGCKVIAVNAPDDTPGIENVDFELTTLEVLLVESNEQGVTVSLR
ncbi:phosphatase, partial [Enterobacteriaceae bacterium ML5]